MLAVCVCAGKYARELGCILPRSINS